MLVMRRGLRASFFPERDRPTATVNAKVEAEVPKAECKGRKLHPEHRKEDMTLTEPGRHVPGHMHRD